MPKISMEWIYPSIITSRVIQLIRQFNLYLTPFCPAGERLEIGKEQGSTRAQKSIRSS